MDFKIGCESDIPEIVELLKLSLGEQFMPKSEKFWKWKHLNNPFGPSPILLAIESGNIIGVRAFLKWELQNQEQTYHGYRAVDTAIHPEHQGKGLFTSLTISLLEKIEGEENGYIFNSPNQSSLPGYLKMGWKKWGKLPLKIQLTPNFRKPTHLPDTDWKQINDLIETLELTQYPSKKPKTLLKKGYIKWRYEECPVATYQFITNQKNYLLIYRVKTGNWGNELRLVDLFTLGELDSNDISSLNTQIKQIQKSCSCRFTTFSGLDSRERKFLKLGILPALPIGPLITLKQLNNSLDPFSQDWNWSLGDLEIF